mgnify:CR=1 FL=1
MFVYAIKAPETNCNVPCIGDKSEICGGPYNGGQGLFSVYKVIKGEGRLQGACATDELARPCARGGARRRGSAGGSGLGGGWAASRQI